MSNRFEKGRSGNPAGRPKKPKPVPQPGSDFAVLLDRTLTVTQGNVERALTVEEALAWQTCQAALAGKRPAQRAVLKMILAREAERPAAPAPIVPVRILADPEPTNADRTLRLLGITSVEDDPERGPERGPDIAHFRLMPWAVPLALKRRRGGRKLTDKQISDIRRLTHDGASLQFPAGTRS